MQAGLGIRLPQRVLDLVDAHRAPGESRSDVIRRTLALALTDERDEPAQGSARAAPQQTRAPVDSRLPSVLR